MTSHRSLALVLLALAACRTATPPAAPKTPAPPAKPAVVAPRATAARPLPDAVRWTRDSAEHRALFLQVYRAATEYVEAAAAKRPAGSWTIVTDADETVIDNSLYELERVRATQPFDATSWTEWTRRREAVPLPGARAFLARVRELGGRIAVVTNRTMAECPDTEAVFRAHDVPYDVMLCRPAKSPSDKNPRFEAVANGTAAAGLPPLEIVAVLGDNINDFPHLSQALRKEPDTAFAPFGARYFVLPNPMYGSWERN